MLQRVVASAQLALPKIVGLELPWLHTPLLARVTPEAVAVTAVIVGLELLALNTAELVLPLPVASAATWVSRGEAELFWMADEHTPVPVFRAVRNLISELFAPFTVPGCWGKQTASDTPLSAPQSPAM